MNISRKIGKNRGVSRLWIEGKSLASSGWSRGRRFDVVWSAGELVYVAKADGKRKVAGTADRPIIDTNTDKLDVFVGMVSVAITSERITITQGSL